MEDAGPTFEKLRLAITERHSVRILYDSLMEEKQIKTRLIPYDLFFSRRSWYVVGRSTRERKILTFNVGRILEIEVLEDSYNVPRGFSMDRYLGNAWHMISESGPDSDIVIRFSKMVARNVAEVVWHKTQKVTFEDDGSLLMSVTVSGLKEISWWILGYGDQAEVLKPAKLRKMIAESAARMVEKYRDE